MFDDRIGNLQKMLARMGPEGRQRYAAEHSDDPIAVSMALFVNNIAKELKEGKRGEPEMQAPVVQQAIQAMNQPRMPQGMPPQGMPPQGQPQAPQAMPQGPQAPQGQQPQMAANGGYMDSRLPEEMGIGALPERSLSNMADGGIVGFADGGDIQSFQAGGKPKIDPVQNFATKHYSLAEQAGKALGVEPGIIIAQWGHETGWGKGVPGKYNLGNIKGKGTQAYDSLEKSRSQYKNYESPEAFVQDYVSQIKRNFPDAVGAGGDVNQFTKGLQKGRLGAYATDPDYAKKIASAVTKVLPIGTAQAGEAAPAAPATAAEPKKSTADKIRETLLPPIDTKPISEVPRGIVQGLASQIAGLAGNVAGAVMPGKEGQGADYAKRAEQYVGNIAGGSSPTSEASKGILDALGYLPNKFSEYVSKPVGEAIDKATGSVTAGDIATRISDFLPALIPVGRRGKTPPKTAEAAPVPAPVPAPAPAPAPAPTPTPAVRTIPTPAQVAAGNPSVTTAKPPVAQPPVAQPRLEGLQRINEAQKRNAEAKLAAERDAAAKAGEPLPPNLAPNPTIVPAPKVNVEGGLPSIITPEAAAFKAQAVARAEARAAERAAEKTEAAKAAEKPVAVEPITVATDAAKTAEAAKADAQVAAGSMAALQERPAPLKFPTPSLVGAGAVGAVGAGAAATEGASSAPEATPFFDRTSGDDTRGFPEISPPLKLTPEVKQEAVALAKAEIPKEERSGFGYEDLLMFGLNLMAGQSSNALTNVGTAGIAALSAKQARTAAEKKTAMEERKIASDEKKDTAYSKYLESETGRKALEDKPQMLYQKAVDKEVADAVASMAYQLAKTPAEKAQLEAAARARAKTNFLTVYPELAGTMGGMGSSLDLTKWGNPVKN